MARNRPDLVFDLDGTLIDSAPDLAAAINQLLESEGRRALALSEIIAMIGDGVATLVRRAYAATGGPPADPAERLARYHAIYGDALTNLTAPYPGVVETLRLLADSGHRMAVCTNKPLAATRKILEALELMRFFAAVSGGDSLPVRKPDAGHLLGTLKMFGATADRAVMIGDSQADVAVARNAGVPVIVVSYGYRRQPVEELGADLVIDGFAEIPAALERLA